MQDIFLARQPILDRQGHLLAFELLFRSANKTFPVGLDGTHATAQVLTSAFGDMGVTTVLGPHKGYINVDAGFLHSDLIELLPKHQVVIELLETITINDVVIARCHELKAKGYSLALDDVGGLDEAILPLLSVVDVVKLDVMQIAPDRLPALAGEFRKYPVKLLAEKVEDHAQARRCADMGFDLFQGYYFARPEVLSGKRADVSKMALLQILVLMMGDAENEEIEKAFKEHATLSYNLLRIVNSAGAGLMTKVSSIKHGLMVIGRRTLQRWVQLLLYASGKEGVAANPLMRLAATRAKLMELIVQQEQPKNRDYADRAFMTGMLSLLDTLLGEPLPGILGRISLDEQVEAALLWRAGELGKLLDVCEITETGDLAALQEKLQANPRLTLAALNTAQLEALGWANSIAV
jgi:EAL and modified HD-GYP domain-containing signal transduction protein